MISAKSALMVGDLAVKNCSSYAASLKLMTGVSERRPRSCQLIEQRLGFLQVRCIEAFGEPAIDRTEQVVGLRAPALLAPEPGKARCRAQLIGSCLLPPRDLKRRLQRCLTFINL